MLKSLKSTYASSRSQILSSHGAPRSHIAACCDKNTEGFNEQEESDKVATNDEGELLSASDAESDEKGDQAALLHEGRDCRDTHDASAHLCPEDVRRFVEAANVPAKFQVLSTATHTVAESAESLGIKTNQVVKSIVLCVDESPPVMVLAAGTRKVHLVKVKESPGHILGIRES
jgi:hypothetical protein